MDISDFSVVLFILAVSFAGVKLKSLSLSGGIAAIIIGLTLYVSGGWKLLFLLGAFFASSSVWSKWKAERKSAAESRLAKTSVRDWQQVAANGGAALIFSIIYFYLKEPIWLLASIGAIASSNADTWASELGVLSKSKPLSVRTWKRVDSGTSGAITLMGTLAALFGALFIAAASFIVYSGASLQIVFLITIAGFIGNIIDTLLGAFVQIQYQCPQCGTYTEKTFHCTCKTVKVKGTALLNNESVNFLSSLLGGLTAFVLSMI